ncbi:NAD-dependent protein deacylase [Isachenkonia alkalipeptolytica]|uniref:NAD-dependent protein deacetylase n=1 Tax=Isachenkonia alkalipeptolytica TaxID=2565777 RepID=A0AA43XIM9_9CLOT|nr:NAD-dependent protein deacylase [Isachenkonia alkalipeptolytica]
MKKNREAVEELKKILEETENLVFFGGAGTSTESSIPDFRSKDEGLYSRGGKQDYPPEIILSHSFFLKHPKIFYQYYWDNLVHEKAKPNRGHYALAALEEQGKLKAVITQNVDGLHQKAGSRKVYELHGSIHRNYCMECHEEYSFEELLKNRGKVPACNKCQGIIRPAVTLYEEPLNLSVIEGAIAAIEQAEVLIVGGTSLVVYPAAGFLEYFQGKKLIIINREKTPRDHRADLVIQGSIGEILAEAVGIEE